MKKSAKGNEEIRVISVDLQEMAPIENTIQIQGDITKQETVDMIMKDFKGNKAELVICDGAPDGLRRNLLIYQKFFF